MQTTPHHALYLLEALRKPLFHNGFQDDHLHGLLQTLGCFDLQANIPVRSQGNGGIQPLLAVLHNLICRGLPTIPSVFIEEAFVRAFGLGVVRNEHGSLSFPLKEDVQIPVNTITDILHLTDNRIPLSATQYASDRLGSGFERDFLFRLLPAEYRFLIQVLETQRSLDSIVPEEKKRSFNRQRVDFSLEIPYLKRETKDHVERLYRDGIVIEVDGNHHQQLAQQVLDESRDASVAQAQWKHVRVTSQNPEQGVRQLVEMLEGNDYVRQLKRVFQQQAFTGDYLTWMQILLSPAAIARIQKSLAECMLQGGFSGNKPLKIAVLERDVPCGFLAVTDFREMGRHLFSLAGKGEEWPGMEVEVFCTPEFQNSPLHQLAGQPVRLIGEFVPEGYDMVVDIAMLQRSNIFRQEPVLDLSRQGGPVHLLIRSSHYVPQYQPRRFYTAETVSYLPVSSRLPNERYEDIPEAKAHLEYFLRNLFRKESFREGQLPILNRALQNQTVIGLLPTGGGKSLTYQLASLLQPGVVMVVDPLKSLMQDQYENLLKIGVDRCQFINSTMNTKERGWATERLKSGQSLFTFISPERLQIEEFRKALLDMPVNKVFFSYCVIDEVHCVSEWGHDFRTSYLELGKNATRFCRTKTGNPIALFGLTATASFDVLADVERELSAPGQQLDVDAIVRFENTIRPELQYEVIPVEAPLNWEEMQLSGSGPRVSYVQGDIWGLKRGLGKEKQRQIIGLLKDITSPFREYHQNGQLGAMLMQAHEKFLPQELQQSLPPEKFLQDNLANIEFKGDELPEIERENKHAGIVFCPHRGWYFGVTDRFKKREDPRSWSGVADAIQRAIEDGDLPAVLETGVFMGSSDEDEKTVKEITEVSFKNLKAFTENKQNLMVATKAFGMGIDKPNIRFTLHINYPSSIESFIQEAGRAGRDRKLALNFLLYYGEEFLKLDKTVPVPDHLRDALKGKIIAKEHEKELQKMLDGAAARNALKPFKHDQDIQLFFHNNSFRGVEKEKSVLYELLTRIFPPFGNKLQLIAQEVADEAGEEVEISFWQASNNPNINRLYVNPDYGYIRVPQLDVFPNDKGPEILNQVVEKIRTLMVEEGITGNGMLDWLSGRGTLNEMEGIEPHLARMAPGETAENIVIPFINSYQADQEGYANQLFNFLVYQVSPRFTRFWVENNLVGKNRPESIEEFLQLVGRFAQFDPEERLDRNLFGRLKQLFYLPRDASDTAKALYRFSCIGLIDFYTIDYNQKVYKVQLTKRPDEYYRHAYFEYLKRYYSDRRAEEEIRKAGQIKAPNAIRQYLYHLVEFAYDQIAKKRRLGIDDMEALCKEGLQPGKDRFERNLAMKEFIFLYFNSKYARREYEIDGAPYSLLTDTDEAKTSNWETVWKFMEAVNIDRSGALIDNVKHLRGATLRLLRTNPENAALLLLKAFSHLVLAAMNDNPELYREGSESLIAGFRQFRKDLGMTGKEVIAASREFQRNIESHTSNHKVLQLMHQALLELKAAILEDDIRTLKNKYLNIHA
jgi:hypothetical protein